jgi:putative membrane-bound dehydrogenase-like protein
MSRTKLRFLLLILHLCIVIGSVPARSSELDKKSADDGTFPADGRGRPLNLGFETGTLADWNAQGTAFSGQPIEGDVVSRRRGDMRSRHAGRFWVGSYERNGDAATGTLTSVPFKVTKPFASFMIGGGSHSGTCVEIVRQDSGQVVSRTFGDDTEDLERVVVDLSEHLGQNVMIRLVDRETVGWGHINFDDFRLHDAKPSVPPRRRPAVVDLVTHAGLEPERAARAMTVPPGFNVTLFAGEPDVVQPIAMAIDHAGRLWVAEAYSYPRRVPQSEARDRILIFEDTDGDGQFDERKVFADRLNLVSGLEVGFGGVWVGAAPQFFFIPDRDGDDRPDGPPEVLLDGWGQHDTHETLNSFTWGPDGWLYGCHGVFTHSRVGKPGTPDAERIPLNAAIWRFHPTRRAFEVFAHGTSNPWGIDFDSNGQLIITACVIPHLYHMIQGGRYERQAGQHFNPYTYEDIKTIADHRHYLGGNPHAGNGRSGAAGGGHAHAGAMIYQGGAWPDEYRGSLFMNNIHGARINRDILTPKGSGFVGSHAPDFLLANDVWSQIISLKYGPDGAAYMIDWYDKNQCHHNEVNAHDRTNGRIFKVNYGAVKANRVNLAKLTDSALVQLQTSPNEWHARHARQVLQERGQNPKADELLQALAESKAARQPAIALRILLARFAVGGLNDEAATLRALADTEPIVRAWTMQLATDRGTPGTTVLARFAELARTDPSPVVRLYLAAALQRLPLEHRWEILGALVSHAADIADHNLPLMYWYAAEPLAVADPARALKLASSSQIPKLKQFMARRIGSSGTSTAIALLVEALGQTQTSIDRTALLTGIDEGLRGKRKFAMPSSWPAVFQLLAADHEQGVRSRATALGLTFGDAEARRTLRAVLTNGTAALAARQEALTALVQARDADLVGDLRSLLGEPGLAGPAIRALSAYDDPRTADMLIGVYSALPAAERRDALNTLAARKPTAQALLEAVDAGKVPRGDLTADLIRQIRNLKDRGLDTRIGQVWGSVRETSGDRARTIARYKTMIRSAASSPPDPAHGRAVFAKVCQQCHTLFGVGRQVGPDLTGSNRADLDYVLSNVLDPSALIGKDYLAHVVATTDGRVITGIMRAEDKDTITLATANETLTLPKSEVAERKVSEQSMMPEDLWNGLSDDDIRSLVSYLASPAQVALPVVDKAKGR